MAITLNYSYEFMKQTAIIPNEQDRVRVKAFTQQEIRTLEQAYTTFSKPLSHQGQYVLMSHTNWEPGHFVPFSGRPVDIIKRSII